MLGPGCSDADHRPAASVGTGQEKLRVDPQRLDGAEFVSSCLRLPRHERPSPTAGTAGLTLK